MRQRFSSSHRNDVTDELAAYNFPGVFYESDRPKKNAEKKWIDQTREKLGHPSDLQLLQKDLRRNEMTRMPQLASLPAALES